MFSSLFKPKWQHKNPDIRIKALTKLSGHDESVIFLSLSDQNSQVRQASIAHLAHLPTLVKISQSDGVEATWALTRLKEILPKVKIPAEGLDDALLLMDDEHTCLQFVLNPKYPITARCALLDKINQPDLLHQIRQQTKQNKKLYKAVKTKIHQQTKQQQKEKDLQAICVKIEQLADLTNKSQIKDRLSLLKQQNQAAFTDAPNELQQHFETAIQQIEQQISEYEATEQQLAPRRDAYQGLIQSAQTLLQQVTNTPFQHTKDSIESALQLLQQAWDEVEPLPTNEMTPFQQKFKQLNTEIVNIKNIIAKALAKASQIKKLTTQAIKLSHQKSAISQKIVEKLIIDWEKAPKLPHIPQYHQLQDDYNAALKTIQAKLKQQNNQKDKNLEIILKDLSQSEKMLEENQIEAASTAFYHAQKVLKNTPDLEKETMHAIKQRIVAIQPQIREMKKWRHWGTEQARHNLINEVQTFIDMDENDAPQRAKSIKKFREQWKKLDKMDGLASEELWQQFDALCNTAYEPCRVYYDQQAESRQLNYQKRAKICQQLVDLEQQTDWDNPQWRELDKQIKKYQKDWRTAGAVAHKEWKKINDQFHQALKQLDSHLKTERQQNWLFRENLLSQANALSDEADLNIAITQAKKIRQQWKVTVSEQTRKEQQLWKNFQTAIDQVYERVNAKKEETEQHLNDNLEQKNQICEQIEALVDAPDLLTQQSAIKYFEKQYHQQGVVPNFHRQQIKGRFEKACAQVNAKIKQLKSDQQREQLKLLQQKHQLCLANEQQPKQPDILEKWQNLPALANPKAEKQCQIRFSKAAMATDNQAMFNKKQRLCIDLEILLKLDSPETEKAARMQRQVELLDQQLSHRADDIDVVILIKQHINQWFNLESVEKEQQEALETRFAIIFQKYLQTIGK